MARDDGRLDISIPVLHVTKHMLQPRQGGLAGDVVSRTNFLFRNQCESTAHGFRRVMECCLERNLRIMQTVGVQLHLSPAGTTAEKVYRTAFTHHLNRLLPSLGTTDRFDGNVATSLVRRKHADGIDGILYAGDLYHFVCTHALSGNHLRVAFNNRDDVAAGSLC